MKKLAFTFIAALGAIALTGCQSGGAYAPKNATKYNLEDQEPFVLLDRMVRRSVTCSGIQQMKMADGRLKVVANVRNREARRIQVQINCVFKDAQGFPTGDETPFQTLILTENAQEGVEFISMNDKAARYTIRVRQAH